MARRLLVEIIADSASLERAMARSEVATTGLGSKLGSLAKTAALGAGAAALGGLAVVLDKSVKAALAGQVSQAKLNAALKATHQSAAAYTPALEAAEAAGRKLGFADDVSRESLAKLEIATGSTKKSIADLGVAEDVARFKHVDLTAASQMLAQAMAGSQRAVKQLGITVAPVTTNLDALKRTGEDLTTVTGRVDEAHAKLADRMATSNAVIQAVTDKVHGQADAFAGTAAGGMAQFSAQLEHIEESIGNALLPILETAVSWVNSHWPQISQVFQQVGTAVKPIMTAIGQIVSTVVGTIKDNWATIGPILQHVETLFRDLFQNIAQIVQFISAIIHGDWSQAWSDFKAIVTRSINAIGPLILDALGLIGRAALALGKAIVDGIVKGLAALGKLVLHGLEAIITAIAGFIGDAATAAFDVGKAIVEGVINGIGSLAGALLQKVKDVILAPVNLVKGLLGIHSPSQVMHDEIGVPMAQGIIEGWLTGARDLPSTMADSVQKAVEAAQKVVQAAQSSFQTSFGGLASIADNMLSGIAGSIQTKAGKALAALTSKHDAAGLQSNVDSARANLVSVTGAIGIEDPVAVAAAQAQLDEALYQQKVAALQKQADAQQKNLDATNAIRQTAFDKALAQLQDHLAKGHTSTKEAMSDIEALLRKYGVTFGNVGKDMGAAWVQGLKDAIMDAAKHGGSLKSVLADQANSINVPHLDTGGYVAQSGIAVVHRGENVVPAGGALKNSGNTYQITVNAIDPRSAATGVIEAIQVYERTNGPRFAKA